MREKGKLESDLKNAEIKLLVLYEELLMLNELEENLVEALSTPVTIKYGRKRSQIVIDCAGREEFERVFARLKNS